MLNFPAWKVVLILIVLVWGALMALPNAFSDGFLGVAPREPQSDAPQDIAAYEQQLGAAEDSWWPSFLPTGKGGRHFSLARGYEAQTNGYALDLAEEAERSLPAAA